MSVAADPAVSFGCKKCHIKRPLSALLGVGLTLGIVVGIATVLGGIAVREVKDLSRFLPQLRTTAQNGLTALEEGLTRLSQQLPDTVQPAAQRSIQQFFGDKDQLLAMPVQKLPQIAANFAGKVPAGAVGFGTGILSAFLISARLPKLRRFLGARIPDRWRSLWKRAKHTLLLWLKAQGKLMAVTFGIVACGMLLLQIPYALPWAAVAALVDAVPLLGTGILLLPWALVKWTQGQTLAALGLALTYAAAAVTRTLLEPRLVGQQLGLDPLVALIALYIGFQLWGFWGLVLAPVTTSLGKSLLQAREQAPPPENTL